MLYYFGETQTTSIKLNQSKEGEPIEKKIDRIVNNNEPISDGAPLIYTPRQAGVLPEYDIRTDRFDIAIDAMDKVTASKLAQREEWLTKQNPAKPEDGKPESIQATNPENKGISPDA